MDTNMREHLHNIAIMALNWPLDDDRSVVDKADDVVECYLDLMNDSHIIKWSNTNLHCFFAEDEDE